MYTIIKTTKATMTTMIARQNPMSWRCPMKEMMRITPIMIKSMPIGEAPRYVKIAAIIAQIRAVMKTSPKSVFFAPIMFKAIFKNKVTTSKYMINSTIAPISAVPGSAIFYSLYMFRFFSCKFVINCIEFDAL